MNKTNIVWWAEKVAETMAYSNNSFSSHSHDPDHLQEEGMASHVILS
jgi:hypothetical protein